MEEKKFITIKGARENNLKNIDLSIPKNELVVFTGVSGSGKSTLAFDTIYSEGQRRYVDSLSSYVRQFIGDLQKPDVDSIDGLSPSIAIDQKTTSHTPRSTVGTVTEIYDYLRLLYARVGVAYCPTHNEPIKAMTVKQVVDIVFTKEEGSKLFILAPIVRNEKGTHKETLAKFLTSGFARVRVDGTILRIQDVPPLDKNKKHFIDIVIDRLILKEENESRLYEAIESAFDVSDGFVIIKDDKEEKLYNEHASCKYCGFSVPNLEPRLFSFNSPLGSCPDCNGIGIKQEASEDLIVPNENYSLNQGAIEYFKNQIDGNTIEWQKFCQMCTYYAIPMDIPYRKLTDIQKRIIMYGSNEEIPISIKTNNRLTTSTQIIEGLVPRITRLFKETESGFMRDYYSKFIKNSICPSCHGARLNKQVLSVRIGGLNIYEATCLSLRRFKDFLDNLNLDKEQEEIARLVVQEIKNRTNFLIDVGLDYLTLSRMTMTLSGGESQRIRLATQIGSKLTGVLYVLDEPSIGLHQRDNDKLLKTLREMVDLGNTLIVVEHDEDTMKEADFLVDIGPGGGEHGGQIVASGTPFEVMNNKDSITGQYLKGDKFISYPLYRGKGNGKFITIKGAETNNLKKINVKIPLNTFTVVTGVSGSGKSSLITETLYKTVRKVLYDSKEEPGKCETILGINNIDKVINVSQEPIGKNPRSNPVTYIDVFSDIRSVFANTKLARSRGYTQSRFSFNVKGGRCESCQGDGVKEIKMNFLPSVYVTCSECGGKRYTKETLEVTYKGKNIYDVLDMTVEEACVFFENIPSIYSKLKTLNDVGLGYIRLGQSSTTLSGGEAQRVKLAKELSKRSTGKTLYILDEPTTGLHMEDINHLLQVLRFMVTQGNTVIVIEHNLDVIKNADYIIDLGPEGGENGGNLIACGTPEEVSNIKESYTGQYLKPILERDLKRMSLKR